MGLCRKYTQYQKLTEAICNHFIEAVTPSLVLLLHISTCLSHIYNSNSKDIRNLQPSLFQTLLWTDTALLSSQRLFSSETLWENDIWPNPSSPNGVSILAQQEVPRNLHISYIYWKNIPKTFMSLSSNYRERSPS